MLLTAELAVLNVFLGFSYNYGEPAGIWHTPSCRLEFTRSDLAELCLCSAWLPGEGRKEVLSGAAGPRLAGRTAHHAGRQLD